MSKWTAVPPASLSVILPGDCTKSLQGAVLGMPQGPLAALWVSSALSEPWEHSHQFPCELGPVLPFGESK